MAVMMHTEWNILDVGFSPEQVARLATLTHGKNEKRKACHLQLHHPSPHISVSTYPAPIGDWEEDYVENKYGKRTS